MSLVSLMVARGFVYDFSDIYDRGNLGTMAGLDWICIPCVLD